MAARKATEGGSDGAGGLGGSDWCVAETFIHQRQTDRRTDDGQFVSLATYGWRESL